MSKKSGEIRVEIYFSDVFQIAPKVLEDYGALDISLINDLPFFIDPFLIFNSEDPVYQALHEQIIKYLNFLREEAKQLDLEDALIWDWFTFREVKQSQMRASSRSNCLAS